jgi:hypothetical protein
MAGKDVIGRLLYQAVVHSRPIVFLLAAAGMLALFALPALDRKNFFDENALLVGSATPNIGHASFPLCCRGLQAHAAWAFEDSTKAVFGRTLLLSAGRLCAA